MVQPCLLKRVITLFRQSFDGGNGLVADLGYGQLAGSDRELIRMRNFEQLSFAEAAIILDIPEGSTSTSLILPLIFRLKIAMGINSK